MINLKQVRIIALKCEAALINQPTPLTQSPLISARDWGLKHAGRKDWVLRHVTLDIHAGERVLVLGASGSGKSSFLQALAGVLGESQQEGQLQVLEQGIQTHRRLAGMVLQDPNSQVILQQLGDDIAFGCENLCVEPREIVRRVKEAQALVGLELDWEHDTQKLSGGQKQRMALAGVLAMQPELLLLDEPTANIDPQGKVEMVQAVEQLLKQHPHMTLIIVEHMLDLWIEQVDRIIVLGNQGVVLDGTVDEVLGHHRATLDDLGVWLPGDHALLVKEYQGIAADSSQTGEPLLIAEQLSIGYQHDQLVRSQLDLEIRAAESLCIVGENGTGKSTLALTLAGALKPLKGQVVATDALKQLGFTPKLSSQPHAWKSKDYLGRLSFVFQEPEYQFVSDSVYKELELSLLGKGLTQAACREKIEPILVSLSLDHLALAHPMSLSGGEKRRLSVASALIHEPKLIFLDEPSFGQDKKNWRSLVTLLQDLQAQGCSIVSITHDEAYIAAMGERVVDLGVMGVAAQSAQAKGRASEPDTASSGRAAQTASAPSFSYQRLHPLIQFMAVAIMTTPLLLSIDYLSASIALVLEFTCLLALRFPLISLFKRSVPLMFAAPLLGISMLLYAEPRGELYAAFGAAVISDNSIYLALCVMLRMFALVLPALALLPELDVMRMSDGLIKYMHVPVKPVLASLSGLRMMSLMMEDYHALHYAHRLRGVESRYGVMRYARHAFSLLVFALRRSGKLAVAMEARAFGAYDTRTCARECRLQNIDYFFMAISALIPTIALVSAYLTGSLRLLGL